MDNIEATQKTEASHTSDTSVNQTEKNSGPVIIGIVTLVLLVVAIWQFSIDTETAPVIEPVVVAPEPLKDVIDTTEKQEVIEETIVELPTIEPIVEAIDEGTLLSEAEVVEEFAVVLPEIDNSDEYIKVKLPELTWRNELLSLLVTDDIIRRFVVFTDNFSQGLLAYEHSPFIKPKSKFTVDEKEQVVEGTSNVWHWDSKTSQRFDLYVDLLRSVDSATLVDLYIESKPLIDEAYNELGYEEDFTYTLQDAIIRVLDMELPQSAMNITRSSVMYKYQDPALESLADSDKLLLRIGKENLLIIKSVLLEINEKLNARIKEAQ